MSQLDLFSAATVCTHRVIHTERGKMIPVGEWRDHGSCRNRDLACPTCGAIVGEVSERKPS